MATGKITEADLARHLVDWLRRDGWEVYQEVEIPGGRVDVVARRGKILWAIEVKLSFGFPVIEQAKNSLGRFHFVSVAVPDGKVGRHDGLAQDVCRWLGIGVIAVDKWGDSDPMERLRSKLFRRVTRPPKLHEEQKDFCPAGGNRGGHWTRFKSTKQRVIDAVSLDEGVWLKDLMRKVDHHYSTHSSAVAAISKLIGTSAIPELRTEIVNRRLCVFLAKPKTEEVA